ncbi:glycine cleavage system protein GcvH [Paenibacillus alkaliterrae]|uniref:glycine cleavage system protein GcvH n=1 Tax=Paenibacillus alkaliterrae TaxID=320909 RepID=UPI001F451A31|nr:glycine cleavage system protein GcvH [Paenibacillus alkaliterrae]MCF2940466.1 glycine cleavage system protein GcvH [Paenibacillus alkaliterrae]
MSEIREQLAYTLEHEWALAVERQIVRIGITDYAQSLLGDIVFVECPEPGTAVSAGESIGTIESVKTVSELYCPVSGTVTKVNETLIDQPELVNEEPYEGGWIVEVEVQGSVKDALDKLLTAERYRSLT